MTAGDGARPTDEHILWMVRSGLVDAEIAARLNIPTGDVKQRIERLARRYGVDGREGLRASSLVDRGAPAGRERPRARTLARRLGPYLAVGLVCAVLGAALALAADSPPAAAPAPTATAAPATVQPTATQLTVTIDGRDWVAAGRFSAPFAGFQPVTAASQREEITVVTLQRDSLVRPTDGWNVTPANGGGFGGTAGGIPMVVSFVPWEQSGAIVAEDHIVAYSRDGSLPQIIVMATERLSGRNHPVLVKTDGGIFIDPRPSRDDVPIDYNTGEALDLGLAKLVGNLGPAARGAGTNWCIDEPGCRTVVASTGVSELLAPSRGTVTCPDANFSSVTVMTFESAPFTLHFRRVDMGVGGVVAGELRCLAHGEVYNGFPMLDAGPRYQLDAIDPQGSPVSVVVDWSGNVWAGDIRPKFECPCRSGN